MCSIAVYFHELCSILTRPTGKGGGGGGGASYKNDMVLIAPLWNKIK